MFDKPGGALGLSSLNHISLLCRSVEESLDFYQNILGFSPIKRPGAFDFDGAWLFNYGIGMHLVQSDNPEEMPTKSEINTKDNHISFQCESMAMAEKRLIESGIKYKKTRLHEGEIHVFQLFFHDPDGIMIELCNCNDLPVEPVLEGTDEPTQASRRVNFRNVVYQQHQQHK